MASRLQRLGRGYGAPALLLCLALALLAWLAPLPQLVATKSIVAGVALALVWRLWAQTRATNLAVARFVAALHHRDFTQSFRQQGRGSGFDELGAAFDAALARLRGERASAAAENRFAAALVDEVPTALLAIAPDGTVELANKAARRLFGDADRRPLSAFARYGGALPQALATAPPGGRRIVQLLWEGLPRRALLAAALVERQGQAWRIVSLDVIQRELEAAEVATQTDLVRVLTHEIMNSITPVTSLAATAASLMTAAEAGDLHAIADARLAFDTLSRRAAGIAGFVESYREFSRSPAVTIRRVAARPWIDELARSFAAMPQADGVALDVAVDPPGLMLAIDPELMGQVLLNLMKNGAEAARDHAASPRVAVSIGTTGGGTRLAVADNGPGVDEALAAEIFLPFFTTKAAGTGVGLSFARQIVLLHGGAIGLVPGTTDGCCFQILI